MNSQDREFQAVLRSWFDESGAPPEPAGLLEAVRDATERSRPHPAWLVWLRGEQMPQEVGSRLNRLVAIGLGAITLVLAIALGIGLVTRPSKNVGNTTPIPVPTQVIKPSASPLGNAMAFPKAQAYQARLVSDNVGWLTVDSNLYRTTDSGKTWTEITLPDNASTLRATVVDADTAFVAFFKDKNWKIAATHDGGLTWTVVAVDALVSTADVTFAMHSPLVGEVAFSTGKVFKTRDGGASWSGAGQTTQPDVGAFLFKSAVGDRGVIWYSNGKYDNLPFDDRWWLSVDAGQTWRVLRFPTDSVSTAGELKGMAATPWIDGDHMIIAVNVENKGATALYRSSDAGRSWRFVHEIPSWQGPLTFLTASRWVGCSTGSGASCWATEDAGATWRQTNGDVGRLDQITWASIDHAWAVINCLSLSKSSRPSVCDGTVNALLLETTDGGATWRRIE
jgi:hypothetical protein